MHQSPTRDQWGDWKHHPCTQAMIRLLSEIRELGIEEISYGGTDDSLIILGTKLGKLNALTGVINLNFIPEEEQHDDGR